MNIFVKKIIISFMFVCGALFMPHAAKSAEQSDEILYDAFSMESLAEIYWALGRQDLENQDHLDNYLRITQCSLFNDYSQNEFEWKEIKTATKQYLKEKKKDIPLRYEFMQPLKLGEYDIKKQQFEVQKDYQLKGARRFEVVASKIGQEVCGVKNKIPGYPRSVAVEFNRPVALTDIPVPKDIALSYIQEKQEKYRRTAQGAQTKERLLELRDVFIVMKLRFFSSQGEVRNADGQQIPHLLAILESIEIYADREQQLLMMSKNMMRRKRSTSASTAKNDKAPAPVSSATKDTAPNAAAPKAHETTTPVAE